MDSRRLNYLRALEIDVWERRDRPACAKKEESAPQISISAAPQVHAVQSPSIAHRVAAAMPVPAAADSIAAAAKPALAVSGESSSQADTGVASMDWPALEQAVRNCTLCPLHTTRTNPVFGVGNRNAQWMIIGEAPGGDEDRQGEPFVGRAGQLLNSMLKAIGLAREQVFITNILKSRPPHNRDPQPAEVGACIPYLYRQIELVNPVLILCVGRIAAQTLLETSDTIGKLRGRLHTLASGRPLVVTYHPAYLLRSPGEKRKSWADLVLAMQTVERLTGRRSAT